MLPLLSLLPAAFQLGQGIFQNAEANNLKESQFVPPELRMKRQLAQQQAFSRRAPGTGQAEEQNRRNLATSLSQARRNFGGDANKMAAISSGAVGQANDATARLQAQGQQFSENAFARMGQADSEIAGVKERNRREYNNTKAELYRASGQNLFNAASNIGSAAIAGVFDGIGSDVRKAGNDAIKYGKDLQKGAKPMAIDRAEYEPATLSGSALDGTKYKVNTGIIPPKDLKEGMNPKAFKSQSSLSMGSITPNEALKRLQGDYTKGTKGKVTDTKSLGAEYIKSGKGLKRDARKEVRKSASLNMLSAQNPWMGMNGNYNQQDMQEFWAWKANQGR